MKTFQQQLFGGEIDTDDIIVPSGHSPYLDFKRRYNYRRSRLGLYDRKCCGTCAKFIKYDYHDKTYFKCRLIGMSNSVATDIRKSNTCNAWRFGREHAVDRINDDEAK